MSEHISEQIEALKELYEAYKTSVTNIRAIDRECGEVISAVGERVASEKKRTGQRIIDLDAIINDDQRSSTSKHLAALEIEKLNKAEYHASKEEETAFVDLLNDYTKEIENANKIRGEIRVEIKRASDLIAAIRSETIGDGNADLYSRWKDSKREEWGKILS